MGKNQGKKQVIGIRFFFCILCVFSLLGMYSSYHVSTSSFSDTERITATFLMGSGICTHRAGYWSHHPECWPVETLTIGGVSHTKAEAIAIMQTPGVGDKTYDLFQELTTTMLNLLCGCTPDCIQETVMQADAWFLSYPVGSGVHASDPAWKVAKPWWKLLEQYNKGLLCEGACNSPPDSPCTLSPDSLCNASTRQLSVYVHDDDYDALTVTFYNAYNDSIIGERSEVDSDSNVSLPLGDVPSNESFGWYVIVSDQNAETRSPIWWYPGETNETQSMDEETSSPADTFDFVDVSPLTVDALTTYTFQVQAVNTSPIPEIMVVYWYNETTQASLLLCHHEGGWNASISIASNASRFWYRLYIAYEAGLWVPVEDHEVSMTDGGDGP